MGLFQPLLALAVAALILGTALPMGAGLFQTARLEATLASARALAQAARDFRAAAGAWPASPGALQGRWLPPAGPPATAWGDPITFAPAGPALAVRVPTPVAPAGGSSAFLATLGAEQRLSAPPRGDQARLELERRRLQCHPSGVIEPCD